MGDSASITLSPFTFVYRTKVDLTKYMENHEFVFDDVFGETVTNAGVSSNTIRRFHFCFLVLSMDAAAV